jgi:hypothetical protein
MKELISKLEGELAEIEGVATIIKCNERREDERVRVEFLLGGIEEASRIVREMKAFNEGGTVRKKPKLHPWVKNRMGRPLPRCQ